MTPHSFRFTLASLAPCLAFALVVILATHGIVHTRTYTFDMAIAALGWLAFVSVHILHDIARWPPLVALPLVYCGLASGVWFGISLAAHWLPLTDYK